MQGVGDRNDGTRPKKDAAKRPTIRVLTQEVAHVKVSQ